MASQKTEDYLKAVYQCGQQIESAHVPSGAIAQQLDVTPSTATLMLQRLAEQGMVEYEASPGFSPTSNGTLILSRYMESFDSSRSSPRWKRNWPTFAWSTWRPWATSLHEPVQPKSVTYVSGIRCKPCDQNTPQVIWRARQDSNL